MVGEITRGVVEAGGSNDCEQWPLECVMECGNLLGALTAQLDAPKCRREHVPSVRGHLHRGVDIAAQLRKPRPTPSRSAARSRPHSSKALRAIATRRSSPTQIAVAHLGTPQTPALPAANHERKRERRLSVRSFAVQLLPRWSRIATRQPQRCRPGSRMPPSWRSTLHEGRTAAIEQSMSAGACHAAANRPRQGIMEPSFPLLRPFMWRGAGKAPDARRGYI